MDVPIGGVGRHTILPPSSHCLLNLNKAGHAGGGTIACIGKFDQISARNPFIYLRIYFIVNCFLSMVLIVRTVE